MPELAPGKLWPVQYEAIRNLELSLAHGRPRALIQMATGSGKTYTAVNACYQLISHAKAKRILFLVDRNNLGRQTLNEFQQFRHPASAYTFAEEYVVQHLRGNVIDRASKVVITTIQRLYSILKGDPEYDPANEDESLFESARPPRSKPVPVEYTRDLPPETFDFIVIDECHRGPVLKTRLPSFPNVVGFPTPTHGSFAEWRAQSLSLLKGLLGPTHVYDGAPR